jgi:lipopolysaccharide exporter
MLGVKAIKGTIWLSSYRLISKVATVISAIVLARILGPEAFGLVALAFVFIAILDSFTVLGIGTAVVQKQEIEDDDYDIAWTVDRLLSNLMAFLAMFFGAHYISLFFEEPELYLIIKVLSILPLFRIIENQSILIFTRNMEYRKRFILLSTPVIVRLVIVIPLAFVLRNVWALILAALSEPLSRGVMSYILCKHIPKIRINKNRTIELFKFGKWVIAFQILKTMRVQIDRIILGKMLGVQDLGYYQVASRFSGEFLNEFYEVISKTFFPIYVNVQKETERLKYMYLNVISIVMFLLLPLVFGLSIITVPLTLILLGEQWLPIVPIMRILLIVGLFNTIIGTSQPLFVGAGYPKYEYIQHLIYMIILIPAIIVLTKEYGVIGTAMSLFIPFIVVIPVFMFLINRVLNVTIYEFVKILLFPIIFSVFMASLVWYSYIEVLIYNTYIQLLIPIAIGISSYTFMIFVGLYYMKIESLVVLENNLQLFSNKEI